MIRVDVGDRDRLHVGRPVPGGREPADQRGPRLVGVPADVDDGHAVGQLQRVHEDVPQIGERDRNRDRPQARADPFHGRHDARDPRVALRLAGHLGQRRPLGRNRNPFYDDAMTADLQLGLMLGYWFAQPEDATETVLAAERLGYASVWTAEAYGSDAI